MARQPRESSPSGIYHVMACGIDMMDLFINDRDRFMYQDILEKVKENYARYSSKHLIFLKLPSDPLVQMGGAFQQQIFYPFPVTMIAKATIYDTVTDV